MAATPTFYVFHGEDEFSRKAQITAMKDAMNDPSGLNIAILDGTQIAVMEAINTARAVPFLSDKRLIIVEGMLENLSKSSIGNKAELDRLVEELPHLPDFSRLVFHENKTISDKNAVVKLARSNPQGFEKIFTAPGNPTQWIIQQAKREHGVEIEKQAAEALKSVINGDLRVADSELAKLAAYVNYERPITEADVALMTTGYVAQADIFEMVDAIGVQDGKTAMQLMQKLLKEGSDPLSMLAMIARQFRLLILAKEYIEETGSASGLDKAIGIHPFVAKKMGQQAHRFESLRNIEDIYRKLADMDFRIKTGKIEQVTALELFIASVTN